MYHGHDGTAEELPTYEKRDYGKLLKTDIPGTADVIVKGFQTLEVWDYKFGNHPVSPKDNAQLTHLAMMAKKTIAPWAQYIVAGIQQQPKGKDMRASSTLLDLFDLDAHEERVQIALAKAKGVEETLAAGEEPEVFPGAWCRWCPAKPACPAMR